LVQDKADAYIMQHNDHKVRYQPHKVGPSGVSANIVFQHPERFGGRNYLIKGDMGIVSLLLQNHPGEVASRFYSPLVHEIAAGIYSDVGSPQITLQTAWHIFASMRRDFCRETDGLSRTGKRPL
jgi:hypothetical protein